MEEVIAKRKGERVMGRGRQGMEDEIGGGIDKDGDTLGGVVVGEDRTIGVELRPGERVTSIGFEPSFGED